MSRGLGTLQRDIKGVLDSAWEHFGRPLRFAELRGVFIVKGGGNPDKGDELPPTRERSLKRALKSLVDRGDVVIIGGSGGQRDPHRYVTVECVVAASGQAFEAADHAKRIWAEMESQASKVSRRLRGGG